MIVKLLTEHHLEFLSLKGGCTGSSESPLVKMSNCWKSRALAHINLLHNQYTSFRPFVLNNHTLGSMLQQFSNASKL